jgi:peptide/nickel transport system permease protein
VSLSGPTEFEAVAAESGLTGAGIEPESDHGSHDPEGEIKGRSLAAIAWSRLRRDKVAIVAGVVLILLVLLAIFADVLAHLYGQTPNAQHNTGSNSVLDDLTSLPKGPFSGISSHYWLGVIPSSGQDILTNLLYGARTSLTIGVLATLLSLVLGVSLGVAAGFYRGWIDNVISRVMDVLLSFPTLLFSIALITVVGFINDDPAIRFGIIVFVLGFFSFPYVGRIVRGQVLSLREKEFVEAARSLGAGNGRIMMREILPNLVGPLLVYSTLAVPNNILGEAGLSYLGIGVPAGTPSWGQMLSDAGNFSQVDPWYLFLPGLAIFITVLAFNLFGDGLRDALDPKSRR